MVDQPNPFGPLGVEKEEVKPVHYGGVASLSKMALSERPLLVGDALCCGAMELLYFDNTPSPTIEERLRKTLGKESSICYGAFVYAILNRNQRDMGWGSILKRVGFDLVSECLNPNSGNTIYFYLYTNKSPEYVGYDDEDIFEEEDYEEDY